MLSYQHGYHAGCFADVLKHATLSRLLHYMTQKDKALFYLDTHSGRGVYDLKSPQSEKTGEASSGIELVWAEHQQLPAVFLPYLNAIQQLNTNKQLRYYPGSPELALQLLRNQDRLFFSELHPGEFEYLNQLTYRGRRVFFSNTDGLDDLNALLPPIEKRGLIFMDPSYEIKTEYREIPKALKIAYQRFSTGVYCVWYPLVDNKLHGQLIRGLTNIGADNNLRAEFYLTPTASRPGMTGCGLWVINPPYVLAEELKLIMQTLRKIVNPGRSTFLLETVGQGQ